MSTTGLGRSIPRTFGPNDVVGIKNGGTGAPTASEAAKLLGVPTIAGDNVMTGRNEFQGSVQINGGLDIRLLSDDALNIVDHLGNINVLDFSAALGRTYTLPEVAGTVALYGEPIALPHNAQSGAYAITASDGIVNCNGTFTATLPTASGVSGRLYIVKNSGAGVVTLACSGGQTIDGSATAVLAAAASIMVASDGANWIAL